MSTTAGGHEGAASSSIESRPGKRPRLAEQQQLQSPEQQPCIDLPEPPSPAPGRDTASGALGFGSNVPKSSTAFTWALGCMRELLTRPARPIASPTGVLLALEPPPILSASEAATLLRGVAPQTWMMSWRPSTWTPFLALTTARGSLYLLSMGTGLDDTSPNSGSLGSHTADCVAGAAAAANCRLTHVHLPCPVAAGWKQRAGAAPPSKHEFSHLSLFTGALLRTCEEAAGARPEADAATPVGNSSSTARDGDIAPVAGTPQSTTSAAPQSTTSAAPQGPSATRVRMTLSDVFAYGGGGVWEKPLPKRLGILNDWILARLTGADADVQQMRATANPSVAFTFQLQHRAMVETAAIPNFLAGRIGACVSSGGPVEGHVYFQRCAASLETAAASTADAFMVAAAPTPSGSSSAARDGLRLIREQLTGILQRVDSRQQAAPIIAAGVSGAARVLPQDASADSSSRHPNRISSAATAGTATPAAADTAPRAAHAPGDSTPAPPRAIIAPAAPPGPGVRLAIIVPFRDQPAQNRSAQLARFAAFMPSYLRAVLPRLAAFHIIVVEQSDDGFKFNRGKALNIGMQIALREPGEASLPGVLPASAAAAAPFSALCLHDVDLLPSPVLGQWYAVEPTTPVHIASVWNRYPYETYVGGIITLSPASARATNGFPNNYWGWGGEDDELYLRLKQSKLLPVVRPTVNQSGGGGGGGGGGAITDLEEENSSGERAGTAIRLGGREEWRNMLKHELMATAQDTWRSNGLNSCKWRFLRSRQLNPDTTVVTVDLCGAEDKWAQRLQSQQ